MKLCVLVAVLLQFCALTCCQDMPDYDLEDMFTGQPSPGVRCTQTVNTADYEDGYEYDYDYSYDSNDYSYDYKRATDETSEGSSSGGGMSGSGSGSGGDGVLMPDRGTM